MRCNKLVAAIFGLFALPQMALADPPFPPTVTASDGTFEDKVVVAWSQPAGGEAASGYRLYRASNSGDVCNANADLVYQGTATSYDDQPPTTGFYYYSVISFNNDGDSNCFLGDSGFRSTALPPAAPVGVSASLNNQNAIVINWQLPPTPPSLSGLTIYRSTTPPPLDTPNFDFCGSANTTVLSDTLSGTATSFSDTTATTDTAFYYALRSRRTVSGTTLLSGCSQVAEGRRPATPPPSSFTTVQATDGTLTDRVQVTWPKPSSNFTSASLVRSNDPSTSCESGASIQNNIQVQTVLSYNDFSAIPGRLYYYWLRTPGPSGTTICSPIDPGHRKLSPPTNVQATDGTFGDRVVVTWNPPAQGDVTGYNVYRTNDCSGTPIATNVGATTFNDTTVTPGVIYNYSVTALSTLGASACSTPDPGYARIGAPGISATKGTFPDKVVVTWTPPPTTNGPIQRYRLYRDTVPTTPCTKLLNGNLPANGSTFDDKAVTPAVQYFYSIEAVTAAGPSVCSPIDLGYSLTECSDGVDNDGDGTVDSLDPGCDGPNDDSEKNPEGPACDDGIDNDGDGKIDYRTDGAGDPGCESPTDPSEDDADAPLLSPAFAKFNTFLGQWNFAELINQGTKDKEVKVGVFNLRGELMLERTFVVRAKEEVDVDVNSLVLYACEILKNGCEGFEDLSATKGAPNGLGRPDGVVDTYGLVRFVFDDSDPAERLVGRMSFYRPDVDGNFSFAFSREFRNPIKGVGYAGANTYDPRGRGFLVPNWAEVIAFGKRDAQGNLTLETQTFTMNIYDTNGELKFTKKFYLPGLGELDIQAGHEFVNEFGKVVEGVYLVEVVPDDPEAEYFLSVSRYSSNAPPAVDPETYNFALTLEGQNGTREGIYAPISNHVGSVQGLKDGVYAENWVEVSCVSAVPCDLTAKFRGPNGVEVGKQDLVLLPKSQFHLNASAVLASKSSGSVELVTRRGSVVSQSMTYLHGDLNDLQSGFASPARTRGRAQQAGTINTFLGMQNVLTVFSAISSTTDATFNITSFRGGEYSGVISLSGAETSGLQISNNPNLNFPPDTFGAMLLETPSEGSIIAEVRRIRVTADGRVDFVMPTLVK